MAFFKSQVFLTPLPCACEKDKLRVLMNGGELCGAAFKGLTPRFSAVVPTCRCSDLTSSLRLWPFLFLLEYQIPKHVWHCSFCSALAHFNILSARGCLWCVCAYGAARCIWGACWSANNQEHVGLVPILLIPHQLLFIKVLTSSMLQSSL